MHLRTKSSFILKAVAAAGLVLLGDRLFWIGNGIGSNLGLFALAWTLVAVLLSPATWRNRGALAAAAGAVVIGATLLDNPGPLGVVLFWTLLSCAMLLPRFAAFDHVGRWALRLLAHGVTSPFGPWIDLYRARKLMRLGGGMKLRSLLPLLPLPLIGGAVFLALFASANPVISDTLLRIGLPEIDDRIIGHAIFWIFLLIAVWASVRPRRIKLSFAMVEQDLPGFVLPGVSVGSVTLALVTFNALFALQNALDIAFLWSGAALPDGMSLAAYAHQGAYPLIATALLAGLFVLVCLRPGSDTARVPLIRRMVVLWVAQNVFLVASSILRTVDYIQVYSLTVLRIAALIWMALVAVGLVLIVWRMLRGKSGAWLINANALAAGLVLAACSVVDLGSIAAAWNVRHAREVGGPGAALDLCYLNELGSSSLVSLIELEQRGGLDPVFARRVAWVRYRVGARLDLRQADGDWIWRDKRRVDQVVAILHGRKLAAPPPEGPNGRGCDGSVNPPPEPAPVPELAEPDNGDAPLTNEAGR